MPHSPENTPSGYSFLLFLFGLFALVSPFAYWWIAARPAWYAPYLLWLVLILLAAAVARRLKRHEL